MATVGHAKPLDKDAAFDVDVWNALPEKDKTNFQILHKLALDESKARTDMGVLRGALFVLVAGAPILQRDVAVATRSDHPSAQTCPESHRVIQHPQDRQIMGPSSLPASVVQNLRWRIEQARSSFPMSAPAPSSILPVRNTFPVLGPTPSSILPIRDNAALRQFSSSTEESNGNRPAMTSIKSTSSSRKSSIANEAERNIMEADDINLAAILTAPAAPLPSPPVEAPLSYGRGRRVQLALRFRRSSPGWT